MYTDIKLTEIGNKREHRMYNTLFMARHAIWLIPVNSTNKSRYYVSSIHILWFKFSNHSFINDAPT